VGQADVIFPSAVRQGEKCNAEVFEISRTRRRVEER